MRGRHADLAAGQHGATAHRLGPRVKAAACELRFNSGVPFRKIPGILKELAGIEVTQSAITQDVLKRAEGLVGQAYEQLRAKIRDAPFVHTDDTGWRTAGNPAQLMVFETDRETVFQIRQQHRNKEVREVIPADYAGVMITECGRGVQAELLLNSCPVRQRCFPYTNTITSAVASAPRSSVQWFIGCV